MLNVADFASGALRPDVVSEIILVQAADLTPIWASLEAMGKLRPTAAEEFKWFTDSLSGRRTQINNVPDDYDETDTSLVVDDGTVFYPNCLALCEATGEIMLVKAVATNTLTVERGIGSVVAAAAGSVADDAYVKNIGPAMGDGSDAPADRTSGPTPVSNYVQTFRQTLALTGRMARVETLTEDERARQRIKKFRELVEDHENTLLYGAKDNNSTDAAGKRVTTSGGLRQAITTNVDAVAGAMNHDRLNQFAEMAFAYGSREKLWFCGTTLIKTVHTIFNNKLEVRNGESAMGLRITQVETPYGLLNLIPHRGFTGGYAGDGIVVDPEEAAIRHTNGGRPMLKTNIKVEGVDGETDEWFSEWGLEWGSEKSHAICTGVTGAS